MTVEVRNQYVMQLCASKQGEMEDRRTWLDIAEAELKGGMALQGRQVLGSDALLGDDVL